ncbi:MAG: divalent cation transporter [Spongiibacteraceae bacterium]
MLLTVITSTLLAGLTMPLGALLACIEKIESNWLEQEFRHSVIAFGGGALLSAVALVMVPEGLVHLNRVTAPFYLILGSCCFMALDIYLNKINTPASQLAAMISDFVPESIALGAAFAIGSETALLLAGLIALQNLPEGFNACHELNDTQRFSRKTIVGLFTLMALLGPVAGVSGYLWLGDAPVVVSAIMLFSAGGILYSIFQDIAPQVKLEKHYAPPLGAILGFALGLIGFMVIH